jgi:hypothetical protein
MTTDVDLDLQVPLYKALAPLTVTALSYARMSNMDKAADKHDGHWEGKFSEVVGCVAHLLDAFTDNRYDFDTFSARRRQLENYLGDEADDPDVWQHTFDIQRELVRIWTGQ